jgi:hypothetical protein
VLFDAIEWDDGNLGKTRRATVAEVEQVIANADRFTRSRHAADRVLFRARTDGGRPLVVVAQLKTDGRLRPITAWEDQ